jgi:hypothetical protein
MKRTAKYAALDGHQATLSIHGSRGNGQVKRGRTGARKRSPVMQIYFHGLGDAVHLPPGRGNAGAVTSLIFWTAHARGGVRPEAAAAKGNKTHKLDADGRPAYCARVDFGRFIMPGD